MKLIKKFSLDEEKIVERNDEVAEPPIRSPQPKFKTTLGESPILKTQEAQTNVPPIVPPIKRKNFLGNFGLAKPRLGKFFRKSTAFILVFLLVLAALLTHFVILPGFRIKNSIDSVQDELKSFAADLSNKDITKIDRYFNNIQIHINKISEEIEQYSFLQNLELTKGYYQNFQIGRSIIRMGDDLIEDFLPQMKSILETTGFNVTQQQVKEAQNTEGEDEDSTFNLIMKHLPDYVDLYNDLEPRILEIFSEVEKMNPAYIPAIGPLVQVRDFIASASEIKTEIPEKSKEILAFIEKIPELIGSDGETNYMVILQNETEMRASAGLITAYGGMKFKEGEMGDIFLSDSWNIENYVSSTLGVDVGYRNIYGQLFLMDRGCGAFYLRAQDAGIYPDLNVTMNMFKDYYDVANLYNKEEYPDYDYIVILNNTFSEGLIDLIQPLEVEGFGQVTADGLYDFIKADTDSVENRGNPERKAIIEKIGDAAKKRIAELGFEKLPQFLELILKSFYAKDLAFAAPRDAEMQEYLDSYSMSGKFAKEYDGDYFHMNEAQNCSLKLNRWVRNRVEQTISIDDNGDIHKDVWVKWEQPKVYEERYENQYSGSLNYSYRAWVRFFTPIEVETYESDGYFKSGYLYYYPKEYNDEVMNKAVSDNIIQFDHRRWTEEDPIPSQDINVSYDLPQKYNYNDRGVYKMLIQKHPGKSWGEPYKITINHEGQEYVVEFVLDRDKVLTYRNGIISVDNYNKELDFLLDLANKLK